MNDLSPQLQDFLREFVGSYEELELLLLFARQPNVGRTPDEVARLLKISPDAIDSALQALLDTGIMLRAEHRGSLTYFSYVPATDSIAGTVAELRQAYDEQPLAIIKLMSANALDRVRGAAARRLADAFRLERPRK